MKKRSALIIIIIFIFSIITPLVNGNNKFIENNKNIIIEKSRGEILYVGGSGPNNYSTIQKAVNAAQNGDTVFIYSNTYNEHILINKSITLIGENKDTTIIEGDLTENIIKITVDTVVVKGLTLKKGIIGIYIVKSSYHEIKNNIIKSNWEGIGLFQVLNSKLSQNTISDNYFEGINPVESSDNTISDNEIKFNLYGLLLTESSNNSIYENEIRGNTRGIEALEQSNDNQIYHNNFISNDEDNAYDDFSNTWDNDYPSGGNYWDDYSGEDNDGDGIGDTPYDIPGDGENSDNYPLMEPFVPQQPPDTPIITGPAVGTINEELTFCINQVIDPEGDDVKVFWDWDDGNTTDWQGPYPSGTQVCEIHTWTEKGTYIVKAKLKDENDAESEWGTLEIIIPRYKTNHISIIFRLLENLSNRSPIFKMILERYYI